MLENKSSGPPLSAPANSAVQRDAGGKRRKKTFDSYEECGCVDRWEAEGGPVIGEDQGTAAAR